MSVLKTIGKFVGGVAKAALPAIAPAITTAIPGVGGAVLAGAVGGLAKSKAIKVTQQQLPMLPPLGSGLPIPRGVPTVPLPGGARVPFGGSLIGGEMIEGAPSGFHFAKDGSGRLVRNRRMNPTNPRALRRAIRRVKSFRRIAQRLERTLPTRTVRSRSPTRGGAHRH